ncbi:MAG: NAD-dependent dehydratase [Micrococcales bacterium 73-15]|uniref:SDR family oxidoreductase n=1 Tax=Salana multivorans TaxID=120377 RepID=UPI0009604450|nr:SDR family oxidoreductase [Salana multivorans]OJX97442.1 MAG: NAD-dependent dehydratase [Micrococcales bacterium 73-15]
MRQLDRVAIVGGAGKVGRLLLPHLLERGRTVVPLVRRADQAEELEGAGATPRLLDIERAGVTDYLDVLDGVDAVVFSAGGGPDGNVERKRVVDLGGALATIAACEELGIRRYVQISAIGVDEPPEPGAPEAWRAYVSAKRVSDRAVRDSDLDWTILRPARLLDDPAVGLVQLGVDLPPTPVTRGDVAAVIAAVLDQPAAVYRQWDLVGGVLPIPEALARAAS